MTVRRRLQRLHGQVSSPATAITRLSATLASTADSTPRRLCGYVASAAALPVLCALGPTAAILAAGYAAAAAAAWARRRRQSQASALRQAARHTVSLLAAQLRAGAAPCQVLRTAAARLPGAAPDDASMPDPICRDIADKLNAVADVAERTGAPAAHLLNRLDAEVRSQGRVAAAVASHTAGSAASAKLLAGLPVAGLLLGQAVGVDAVEFLLHTPLGAACAFAAALLQAAGLAWSRQITAAGGPFAKAAA